MISPARQFGPYRLLRPIGKGGFAVVYRAQHVKSLTQVALKTLVVSRRELLWSMRHEIHALRRIEHPGVVRIVDEGVETGVPWYAMEIFEGMTLHAYLRSIWFNGKDGSPLSSPESHSQATWDMSGVLDSIDKSCEERFGSSLESAEPGECKVCVTPVVPPREERRAAAGGQLPAVLTLLRHLCATLAHIHGNGFVHLDLKPTNIFIRSDWTPVLFDFGLVSRVNMSGRENLKIGGAVKGTLGYMAPEQCRGEVVDARSDLYSLGCILYEFVTGQLPFQGGNFLAVSEAHQKQPPVPPSQLVHDVPPDLEDLIVRLLTKRPRDRLGHAHNVAHALSAHGARNRAWASKHKPRDYLYRSELVGRERALEWLQGHLGAVVGGQGRCILVGGESGLGKTRLMMEFARLCKMANARVVAGQTQPASRGDVCHANTQHPPLYPFRRVLQAVADHCLELGQEETDRVLGARGKILEPYLPALSSLPGQDQHPSPAAVTSDAAQHLLLNALAETLAAFGVRRPLVIILDDLQWGDELSLRFCLLVQNAGLTLPGVLVVGTYRTDEVHSLLEQLLETTPIDRHLEIGALNETEVGQIVGGMLGLPDPGEPLVRFLARRSGGNPFFVAEYLRLALSEGILRRDEHGMWQLADQSDGLLDAVTRILPLPRSLRDVVVRRLSSLPERANRLLALTSVVGKECDVDLLQTAGGQDHARFMDTVDELLARHVLEEAEPGRLRFTHDTLQELAYQQLTPHRRRELHGIVAAAIEGKYSGTSDFHNHYGTLAHHWDAANVVHKAIEYYEKAGEFALGTGAYGQAHGLLTKVLQLDAAARKGSRQEVDAYRRARWKRRLAECCLGLGKPAEAGQRIEEALVLLGYPVPVGKFTFTPSLLYQIALQTLHYMCPFLFFNRARRSREVVQEAATAYNCLLMATSFEHKLTPILYAAVRTTNLAEFAGSSSELARAYASLHGILGVMPYHRLLSERYARRARKFLQKDDPTAQLWVVLTDAVYRLGRCDWDRCLVAAEEGRKVALETGAVRYFEEFEGILSAFWFLRGDLKKSMMHAESQRESTLRGDQQGQCFSLLRISQNQLVRGGIEEAHTTLETAAAIIAEGPGKAMEVWHQALLGLARLLAGDARSARDAADRALRLTLEGSPVFWYLIDAYSSIAAVYLELRQREGGAVGEDLRHFDRDARRACRSLNRCARVLPACAPRAARLQGIYRWQSGQAARARADWERSRRLAVEHRMPYEEAIADLEIGRHLPTQSPERRKFLLQAVRLLESICPRGPDLAQARGALDGDT